ncbi:hypothetical protein RvY_10350 [Ramazzottius varieornatus]|uniref:Uncharacterized protein n=1 Tax=Ramazzottius varieornatus TaxID=947166 RepID=A0A1D1VCG8_RAMVA|nr:hypothetical protein RvY_10350 [Ramazzottius varieornatus]
MTLCVKRLVTLRTELTLCLDRSGPHILPVMKSIRLPEYLPYQLASVVRNIRKSGHVVKYTIVHNTCQDGCPSDNPIHVLIAAETAVSCQVTVADIRRCHGQDVQITCQQHSRNHLYLY